MITTISLVTIRHYTKISYYYSSHCTFHSHNLFCNWKFVSLTLPHLLHSSSPTLPSGNHLFFVSMTLFMLCYASSGFPGGSDGKESSCNTGDLHSVPGLGRSPGEGNGFPLQYSGLENSMDCKVHDVAKSRTQRATFTPHTQSIIYALYIMWNARLDEANWNKDCQEKYQHLQICRWHHPYDRKWRGFKEPLEDERGQ